MSINMAFKGSKKTEEHKIKIGKSNSIALKKFYRTKKGKEQKIKFSKMTTGSSRPNQSKLMMNRKTSFATRKKIGDAHRGTKKINTIAVVDKRIEEEISSLSSQGFRCVPVGGSVRPDIVAVKDGKIYAIEVEYKKRPDYSKYKNTDCFDDIIWILKHKYPIK